MTWTKEVPKVSAYYWIITKNRDDLLDCSPEVAYLYYDGRWSVPRAWNAVASKVEEVEWWYGPIEGPPKLEEHNET